MAERKVESDDQVGYIVGGAVDEAALMRMERALCRGEDVNIERSDLCDAERRTLLSVPWPRGAPVDLEKHRRPSVGNVFVERRWDGDLAINMYNNFPLDVVTRMEIIVRDVPDSMQDTFRTACAHADLADFSRLAGPMETLAERVPSLAKLFVLRAGNATIWRPAMNPIVFFPCVHWDGSLELKVDRFIGSDGDLSHDKQTALKYLIHVCTSVRFVGALTDLSSSYIRMPWLSSRSGRWRNVCDLSKLTLEREKDIKTKLQHLQPQLVFEPPTAVPK